MRPRSVAGDQGGIRVTVYLDAAFVQRVDVLADKLGVNRSQMLRNLAECGYEDAKLLDAVGLFTLCRKLQDIRKGNYGPSEQLQPA